jgi:SEC-C motif-containing protein
MSKPTADHRCPCSSDRAYSACCGPYVDQALVPETAECLMRSRYAAYVLGREAYLLRTWHPTTRPTALDLESNKVKWLGLEIVRTEAGGTHDPSGIVEFVARYKVGGKAERLHETSRFVREHRQWLYVDGQLAP